MKTIKYTHWEYNPKTKLLRHKSHRFDFELSIRFCQAKNFDQVFPVILEHLETQHWTDERHIAEFAQIVQTLRQNHLAKNN